MIEPKTTYTRAEIREAREAFRDWGWTPTAMEPDSRITVLYDRRPSEVSIGFLCQHEHGWFLVRNADDLVRFARTATPGAWRVMLHNLDGAEIFVVPTEQELEMGGFRVTVDDEPEEGKQAPEPVDEAKEQIDAGFQALGQFGFRNDGTQMIKAQAHFMAAIAISLYDLVGLYKKYEPEGMEIAIDDGPDEAQETRAAADVSDKDPGDGFAPGPVADEDYPWAR